MLALDTDHINPKLLNVSMNQFGDIGCIGELAVDEFRKLTEIPVLLNTSFNVHNEPIIEEPCRAVTHLVNGIIDKLVFENYVLQFRQP